MKSGFYHLSAFIIAALLFPGCQGEAEQRHILITENGMKLEVPEGYVIETVAGSDLVDYPMFATLDDRGRLFVFESIGNVYENSQEAIDTPQFQIKLLKDLDDDGIYDQATIFADSLSFPQGGVVVDGSLYASSAPDLIKLTDTDDDGVADQREVLLSGWVLNVNANSLIGPFLGPDGLLYLTSAIEGFDIKNREGHQISGETARVWRVKSDGSELEWISAGGMNNPVELAFTPAGEVMGTLTFFVDPQRGLRDALTYWIEGGVYGKENSNIERDQLPRTGELMPVVTPYSRVAPSGLTIYRQSGLGESYTNNLFSVQFNTHQVWRHQLRRRGGGFSTVDDVFLTCDHPDFHPTDVLEAGDGSLLIVETGGWFILGCPLSQVSKPQLEGGIYSVKKANSSEKRDPYGKSIDWEASGEEELLKLATDPRIFVRDQAFKALIKHETGIDILKKIMDRDSEELRLRATYALYQTGSETAMHLIKERLMDSSVDVRIAAAKCAGLSKNQLFTDALIQQLSDTSRAVKRQVATALGQIGNPIATRPLLEAATGEEDRYVLHAITFALIQSGSEAVLLDALSDQDPVTRQVALVSLDQTESSPLSLDEVLPFIQDPSNLLARTGLWVASHHPGWARSMVPFLKKQIADNSIRSFDYEVFEELLITFSEDEQIQQWLAQNLMTVNSDSTRDLILSVMREFKGRELPNLWIQTINSLLVTGNVDLSSQLLDLIRTRRIDQLDDAVKKLASDDTYPATIRIKAIDILTLENDTMDEEHFSYLLDVLTGNPSAALSQQALNSLSSTPLTRQQVELLATEYLPGADLSSLPRLLMAFSGPYSDKAGRALIAKFEDAENLDHFSEDQIIQAFAEYSPEVQEQIKPLLSRIQAVHKNRLTRINQIEQQLDQGDEARGRELYFGKATCWTCHTMGNEGYSFGPDLTSIQKDRSEHDILEAILYPSVSFVREFETYEIRTNDQFFRGIILERTPGYIDLGLAPKTTVRIMQEEIQSIKTSDLSLMPQGLADQLTEEELADLIAFLMGEDLIY